MARNSATITCSSLRRDYQSLAELMIEGDLARWRKQQSLELLRCLEMEDIREEGGVQRRSS